MIAKLQALISGDIKVAYGKLGTFFKPDLIVWNRTYLRMKSYYPVVPKLHAREPGPHLNVSLCVYAYTRTCGSGL